jgi:hypothetical protein
VIDAPEHGGVRPPAVPQELDHRDDDRDPDAGNRAEERDAGEADDRQPELPSLDAVEPPQVANFEETDGGRNDDGRERGIGQVLQQVGRCDQQHGDRECADDAGELVFARPLPRRRARRAAADGKPWNRPPARFATPSPTISWFGSTLVFVFAAYTRESTLVSANDTSATARPPTRIDRCPRRRFAAARTQAALRQRAEHRHVRALRRG